MNRMTTNEDLVLLKQNFKDCKEVISTMAAKAKAQGLVDDTYLPAILEREEKYPTGLELPVCIAIPHLDKGVKQSWVSVVTMENPVTFYNMDCSGGEVPAQIVFVFGIMDPKDQLAILKKFASSFAHKEKILPLLEADNPRDLLEQLNGLLDGMLDIQ